MENQTIKQNIDEQKSDTVRENFRRQPEVTVSAAQTEECQCADGVCAVTWKPKRAA